MLFRFSAIFPVLLSIVAFILSILVLLSGYKTSFLQDVFVLKVDTSQIAQNIDIDTVLTSVGIDPDTIETGITELDSAITNLTSSELGNLLNTAAHELGLHDFYTAHIMTWCEGTLVASDGSSQENNSTANTTNSAQNVTGCTSPTEPFSFDPVAIIEDELLHNITLDDINFPTDDINKVVSALKKAYRAMSVCYLIGVIFAGLSVLFGLGGFFASRLLELVNNIIAFLGFLLLGAASAIGTAIAIKVRDVINDKAAEINVAAYSSTRYLGMTWASVGCLLIVSLWWCFTCCCGSHSSKMARKSGPYDEPYNAGEKPRRRGRFW